MLFFDKHLFSRDLGTVVDDDLSFSRLHSVYLLYHGSCIFRIKEMGHLAFIE